jgi:hypothetical protein
MLEIDEYLKKLYEKQLIAGFEYRVLKRESDVREEDLDIAKTIPSEIYSLFPPS